MKISYIFLDELLYIDPKHLFSNVSVFITRSLWLHIYIIVKEEFIKCES